MSSDLYPDPIQTPQSQAILGAALIEMQMAMSPLEFASGNASVSILCGLYSSLYVILIGSLRSMQRGHAAQFMKNELAQRTQSLAKK